MSDVKTADQATPITRSRLQFSLKHLFACMTLVAIGLPVHRTWGWSMPLSFLDPGMLC
jgi:hypothetical protein